MLPVLLLRVDMAPVMGSAWLTRQTVQRDLKPPLSVAVGPGSGLCHRDLPGIVL